MKQSTFVVIPGFEKCWTTSMANSLVKNKICQLLTVFEQRFFAEKNQFPYFSILINSLFDRATRFVIERFGPPQIFPISVPRRIDAELAGRIAGFIGAKLPEPLEPFTRDYDLSGSFSLVDPSYEDPWTRQEHGDYFNNEIRRLNQSLEKSGCDMSLFDMKHLLTHESVS